MNLFKYKKYFIAFLCSLFLIMNTLCADASSSNITRKHKETKERIKKLKILENIETNKLYKNQLRLENAEKDLKYSQVRYSVTSSELSNIESDLSAALVQYNAVLFHVRARILNIYKHHRKNLFEMIFSSLDVKNDGINKLLDNIYYQNIIARADKNSLYHVKQNAKRIALIKYQQEREKRRLSASIRDINEKQKSLQKAIDKNEDLIKKLRTDRRTYEKAEKELAKQSAKLTTMIERSAVSTTNISSGFIKPVAGYISSSFGSRIHPIFKSRTFHSGVDIAGPNKAPIRASNSGKVIYVGWYGGYGKVVIIDHGVYNGNKITTLYAHLSSYRVGVGDSVKRGQIIANEGTTGYSTGPHLHFEVRVNGRPRNPLNYI